MLVPVVLAGGRVTVPSPAENAATVRDHLAKPRADWLAADVALAALLAQAEAGTEWKQAHINSERDWRREWLARENAEADRDAAVRERDRLREAAAAVLDYEHHPSRASLSALRAALTGEGTG